MLPELLHTYVLLAPCLYSWIGVTTRYAVPRTLCTTACKHHKTETLEISYIWLLDRGNQWAELVEVTFLE